MTKQHDGEAAYISVKRVTARRATQAEFARLRGFTFATDVDGYILRHAFGSTNDAALGEEFAFMPTAAFNATYREIKGQGIGTATELLRAGLSVTRTAWGEGVWLELHNGFEVESMYGSEKGSLAVAGCVFKKGKKGTVEVYQLTHADMLAEDWVEAETSVYRRMYGLRGSQ